MKIIKILGTGFVINLILKGFGIEGLSFSWWVGVLILATIFGVLGTIVGFYDENN